MKNQFMVQPFIGPIDSFEWIIVENFLSTGENELPCVLLIEKYHMHKIRIPMRLDCDEDIESARNLERNIVDWTYHFTCH